MNFQLCVRNLLWESPDNLTYQGNKLTFHGEEGDPHTFFITNVSIRPDCEEGHYYDFESTFGPCIVYAPSKTSSSLSQEIRDEYYDDIETSELTHSNLGSLLIYNEEFTYEDLKKFGIRVYSFKKNVDNFFENYKKVKPKATFTLTKEQEAIGLKYRGRFWFIDGKVIVSMWHFDKKTCMKFLIPFLQNKFQIKEDNIIFEIASFEKNEKQEAGTGNYISGTALKHKSIELKPYEKEISTLLAQLHSTPSGQQKEKLKTQIKELIKKYNLDPKKYGFDEETPKASAYFAQKLLGGSNKKDETTASIKAKQQTSESIV